MHVTYLFQLHVLEHSTLNLTCIQHAFCPRCITHVVLIYATHEYNIHYYRLVWINIHASASNMHEIFI